MSTTQVAIRFDDDLLERLDWLVARCSFESRADAVRAALVELAERERQREIGEQIAEGYRRIPQTADELPTPDFSTWDALDDGDWGDWA
jgi:Arc/MetJ-type ribon-helix-helix transcriptional regulator